jgi:hypothetical protein
MKIVKRNTDWYVCTMATVKAFQNDLPYLKRLSEKYPLSLWRCAYEVVTGKIKLEENKN